MLLDRVATNLLQYLCLYVSFIMEYLIINYNHSLSLVLEAAILFSVAAK